MKLASSLYELVELITSTCNNWKNEGKLKKKKRDYVRYVVTEFDYNSMRFSWSHETITKEEWDLWDIYNLVDSLKTSTQFKSCATAISETYNVSEDRAEYWLSRFAYRVVSKFLEGNLDFKTVTSLIVDFINELGGNPVEWNITAWLDGIYMETEQIEIDRGVVIRRPKPQDVEYEFSPLEVVPDISFEVPSAVLEINKRIKIEPNSYPELEKILISLRLYKLGSVNVGQIKWKPNSILGSRSILHPHPRAITYTYSLTDDDKESLSTFVREIKDKLPVEEETGKPLSSHPIGIAILRYQDALSKPEAIENKIAYAIMGLEALYLKTEERQELSHRLAQRVAKVMKAFNEPPVKVYNIVKDGYEIRSNFVHGSTFNEEDTHNTKDLLNKIAEYLRRSILVFLLVPKEKDAFIGLIDNAMLENSAEKKLQQLITENIGNLGLIK